MAVGKDKAGSGLTLILTSEMEIIYLTWSIVSILDVVPNYINSTKLVVK